MAARRALSVAKLMPPAIAVVTARLTGGPAVSAPLIEGYLADAEVGGGALLAGLTELNAAVLSLMEAAGIPASTVLQQVALCCADPEHQ